MNDNPADYRLRHVESFLHDHLFGVVRLDPHPPEGWTGSRFGWDPPLLHEGLFVLPYCPAILARVTAKLFVDETDDYLRALVSCISLHVIHHELPEPERVRTVESALYDTAPGSLALLSQIEMAALDK